MKTNFCEEKQLYYWPFSHCDHICIPRKTVADQDSQVLCILGVSEFFAMDGVVGINRFPLLGDLNNLAFVRDEWHEPVLMLLLLL